MKYVLLLFMLPGLSTAAQIQISLIGEALESAPYLAIRQTFHGDQEVVCGIHPDLLDLEAQEATLYIVDHQPAEAWTLNPELNDVRTTGPQQIDISSGGLASNLFSIDGWGLLDEYSGDRPGHAFDAVVDLNNDGMLSASDLIDGGEEEAGFYKVGNLLEPGPQGTLYTEFSEDFWHTFRVYIPSGIDSLESIPLVVVSHGWTHEYTYYDYIGEHLASWGYVVMSHRNDVGSGNGVATETASQTALENIDAFFENIPEIAGGILEGKINAHSIVHTGHSTGGECVVRAYKRLYDGEYVSPFITHEDIVCISSLAPVAFLDGSEVNPEGCNYHQFLAGADTDVSGFPYDNYTQPFTIYERGYGNRQITYIHGAGHEDLHDEPGNPLAAGPNLIGKEATHSIVKPYFLALCERYTRGNVAMKDYFTRNRQEFRPLGIEPSLVITGEYRDAVALTTAIDDFQSEPSLEISSSGAAVTEDLLHFDELLLRDTDASLSFNGDNWANGMTRARYDDNPRGAVLAWDSEASLCFDTADELADWTSHDFLSFRTCQLTRHPLNDENASLFFHVELEDAFGNTATLSNEPFGALLPPYPRGADGYFQTCLDPGEYEVHVGGGTYDEEILFTITGYLEEADTGSYALSIPEGEPCTTIEILMYDTWGDGWNGATLDITDAAGETVFTATMNDGFEPDPDGGWQNEFHTYRLPLDMFRYAEANFDLNQVERLCFKFGGSWGNTAGAIGLDDIELAGSGPGFVSAVSEHQGSTGLHVYPNPSRGIFHLEAAGAQHWEILSLTGHRITGGLLAPVGTHRMDLSHLPPGTYVLITRGQHHFGQQRLVLAP